MVCSFVKLTIKQTKTLIFRDRCLSLFYGVLFPLNEVQIYSRRYAQKLAYVNYYLTGKKHIGTVAILLEKCII